MKLTSENAARLTLPGGKSDHIEFDDELAGFGLRIRAGGSRVWLAQYRLGTKQRRVTLGSLAAIDAAEARRRAKVALGAVALGHDPQKEKSERKAQAAETFGRIVELYLPNAGHTRNRPIKPKGRAEIERYLQVLCKPLHELPVKQVTRKDISAQLARIAKDSGPIASNRAQNALSAMFSWAISAGEANENPAAGVNKMGREDRRDRVLTDEELRLIWRHADEGEYGAIVRLLILTGQRREEVAGMLWRELTGDLWIIGADRSKNGLPHEVPLASDALAILSGIPRRDERELVFGVGSGGFSGWSKSKAGLDRRILGVPEAEHGAKAKLAPWRLHDLRRTAATRMADLGVLPHVIEAVLNHASGYKRGVAGIYNRSTYASEKRTALAQWAERVKAIVGGKSNVVTLRAGAA